MVLAAVLGTALGISRALFCLQGRGTGSDFAGYQYHADTQPKSAKALHRLALANAGLLSDSLVEEDKSPQTL